MSFASGLHRAEGSPAERGRPEAHQRSRRLQSNSMTMRAVSTL